MIPSVLLILRDVESSLHLQDKYSDLLNIL